MRHPTRIVVAALTDQRIDGDGPATKRDCFLSVDSAGIRHCGSGDHLPAAAGASSSAQERRQATHLASQNALGRRARHRARARAHDPHAGDPAGPPGRAGDRCPSALCRARRFGRAARAACRPRARTSCVTQEKFAEIELCRTELVGLGERATTHLQELAPFAVCAPRSGTCGGCPGGAWPTGHPDDATSARGRFAIRCARRGPARRLSRIGGEIRRRPESRALELVDRDRQGVGCCRYGWRTIWSMTEWLLIIALGTALVVRIGVARRGRLRRARAHAEEVLDELAAATCDALARGPASRRAARAVRRYERTRERVAAASTARELEGLVVWHQRRRRVVVLASEGSRRVQDVFVRRIIRSR